MLEQLKTQSNFTRAYARSSDTAMKLIFFARDVRQGLGERRAFRICLRWLCLYAPESVEKNALPQSELPSTLYIISDMEFDSCTQGAKRTNFERAKRRFAERGYQLPRVVFWNVASRALQLPVTKNEQGVALVSGCSPRIFSIISEGRPSPQEYMNDILMGERYAPISA